MSLPVTNKKIYTEADQADVSKPPDRSLSHYLSQFVCNWKLASAFSGDLLKKYTISKYLEQGSCGIVFQAHRTTDKTQDLAIKFYKNIPDWERQCTIDIDQQAKLHTLAPNFVLPIIDKGVMNITSGWFRAKSCYFVTKYFGNDLFKIFETSNKDLLDFSILLKIFQNLLKFYKVVDQNGIALRDLKPKNILMNPDGDLKIIDCVHGAFDTDSKSLVIPPFSYRSPLFYLQKLHKSETAFALGATIFFILTGSYLFGSQSGSVSKKEHLKIVFSIVDQPSPELIQKFKKKKLWDDKMLPDTKKLQEVQSTIESSLTNGRFLNVPKDTQTLANELYCLIQGLVRIEDPWTPEQALSNSLILRLADDELEQSEEEVCHTLEQKEGVA